MPVVLFSQSFTVTLVKKQEKHGTMRQGAVFSAPELDVTLLSQAYLVVLKHGCPAITGTDQTKKLFICSFNCFIYHSFSLLKPYHDV